MTAPTHHDSIVIGSGQGGTPLAAALARAGRKTALVERAHIGGCCVNEGCTPTKTMIASGRVAYLAGRRPEYGVHANGSGDVRVQTDMLRVRQRKRDIVASFRGGSEARTAAAGVEVVSGTAAFVDAKTLRVVPSDGSDARLLSAETIFINTGERPARPVLEGLDSLEAARVLDSTSVMELDAVPAHLVVLGGGYVGLEFGQLFRRLGAAVTIVQRGKQLLPREDPEVAACMLEILREDGIVVYLDTETTHVSSSLSSATDASTPITLGIRPKAKPNSSASSPPPADPKTISCSHILLATGRVPNVEALNLPAAGIATTGPRGHIAVNDRLETSVPGIYALGDVKGGPAFTHISYDDFRILRANLGLDQPPSSSSSDTTKPNHPLTTTPRTLLTPYVVYTDPQLGHIGLHASAAATQYGAAAIRTASMPYAHIARALETAEPRGMLKAVVHAESARVLGFTALGLEAGELMAVVQAAMMGGVTWRVLRDAVWAHPSLAEGLNNLWGGLGD